MTDKWSYTQSVIDLLKQAAHCEEMIATGVRRLGGSTPQQVRRQSYRSALDDCNAALKLTTLSDSDREWFESKKADCENKLAQT